jgi:hypothetical protein
MGKHASDLQKAVFLTHLQYFSKAEAVRKAGLIQQTANDIKMRAKGEKLCTKSLVFVHPQWAAACTKTRQ